MASINGQKAAGAAGVLFIALTLAAGFLVQPPPTASHSPAKFFEYYNDNRNALLAQGIIAVLANIPAFVFVGGLWTLLRREEGDAGVLAAAAIFAFVVLDGIATLASAWSMGIAALADGNGLTEEMSRTLGVVSTMVQSGLMSAMAPAAGISGYILTRGTTMPRWIGFIGLLGAVLGVIAIFGVANDGAFTPFGLFSFGAFLAFSAYVIVLGVFMWLRAGEG